MDELATKDQQPVSESDRKWATLMHLSALLGLLILGGTLLLPLVMWMARRKQSAFVNDQGKEAVNFQLTWLLISLLVALALVVRSSLTADFYLFNWLVNGVVIICAILAAVKANRGELFRYPLAFRFIK